MDRPTTSEIVVVDFETFADLRGGYSLSRMSTRAYLEDDRFDILSVSIAMGMNEDLLFFHKGGRAGGSLDDAKQMLEDAAARRYWLVGHNLDFDGLILALKWNIRFEHMFDTIGWLRYRGFGGSLANGGHLVGLRKESAPEFCESSLADDASVEQLAMYNCTDVEIARRLVESAAEDTWFTPLEFWASDITSRENIRGIAIDRKAAAQLASHFAKKRDEALTALTQEFRSFDTNKLRSSPAVREFLRAFGIELAKLDKRDPALAALKAEDNEPGRFLRLREAVDTWERYAKRVDILAKGPERIYGQLHYHGAHTGRFTSGGINAERLNLQNLHKGREDTFEELSLIRSLVVADENESFVSADLATIEPRVLAFLAGQRDQIEQFAKGQDVYQYFISGVFPGVKIVKGGENDHLRQLGKKAVLGLGYGQGERGFLQKLRADDPCVSSELAVRVHRMYRRQFSQITKLRWDYFSAFRKAVDSGVTSRVGYCAFRRVLEPTRGGITVEVLLPTNRLLTYRSVLKTREMNPFGKIEPVYRYSDDFQFDASMKGSRGTRGSGKKMKCSDGRLRAQLLSQTLIENIVSAVARDIIVGQMYEIEQAGLRVKFSVHDEAVVCTRRCVCPNRDVVFEDGCRLEDAHELDCPWMRAREIVRTNMSKVPNAFPKLSGLPVACELSDAIRDSYGT